MYLEYGVNEHGEIVYIDQVGRGLTALHCPYCGGQLIARKGQVLVHHFAHAGDTCREVDRDPSVLELPAYDNFNLYLPGKVLASLKRFHEMNDFDHSDDRLEEYKLIQWNTFAGRGGKWEITKLGKIPLGELSLMLFNEVQEELIFTKHDRLEIEAIRAIGTDNPTPLADLRIYRAQIQRILKTSLYFLLIKLPYYDPIHKIGVTTRPIEERIEEIRRDLHPDFGSNVEIHVRGVWEHRGNVELYFKHRYQKYQYLLGRLTEYYLFSDIRKVLNDLNRMKPMVMTDLKQEILDGLPSRAETGRLLAHETLPIEHWLLLSKIINEGSILNDRFSEQQSIFYNFIYKYPLGPLIDYSPLQGNSWLWSVSDFGRRYVEAFKPFYEDLYTSHYIEERRRANIRASMQRARERGKHVGRPEEAPDAVLAKYPQVVEALERGDSLRTISRETGVAVNTVRKVKEIIDNYG